MDICKPHSLQLQVLVHRGNYAYDDIGNLIEDDGKGITEIPWNHSNKILKITFDPLAGKPDLEFRYDPMGNRIVKIVESCENNWQYTYYARGEYESGLS